MPRSYSVTILSDAGTGDNNWIELLAASGIQIAAYKFTVALVAAPADLATGRIRVFRTTTAGSGQVAGTIVDMDPSMPASTSSVNVKAGGVFGGTGTTTDTLFDCAVSLRQTFEWVARDKDDYLWSAVAGRLVFRLVNLSSSGNHIFTVYFKEFG